MATNMITFSRYAEKKFDILNKHKVYFTKEQIEEVLKLPKKITKKGKYITHEKDNIKVISIKEMNKNKIVTFYPIK